MVNRNKSGPPVPEDITTFVERTDDLGLELFAYRSFKEAGWWAEHGHFYRDPILDKYRQFDVQGGKELRKDPSRPNLPTTGLYFAAECKNVDPAVPVIVSRVPRSESESYHCLLKPYPIEINPGRALPQVLKSSERDAKPYHVHAPVGKSIVQYSATSDKLPDDPYAKWSQALASCASLVMHTVRESISNRNFPQLLCVIPVLILADNALWTVDYDIDGVRGEVKPADETTFFIGRDYALAEITTYGNPHYNVSHLHIYTKAGFVKALQTLNNRQYGQVLDRYFKFGMGLE